MGEDFVRPGTGSNDELFTSESLVFRAQLILAAHMSYARNGQAVDKHGAVETGQALMGSISLDRSNKPTLRLVDAVDLIANPELLKSAHDLHVIESFEGTPHAAMLSVYRCSTSVVSGGQKLISPHLRTICSPDSSSRTLQASNACLAK